MRNTKLYVYEGWKYSLASTEDIQEVHGKCGTCKHQALSACYHPSNIDNDDCPKQIDPVIDYCNHYKLKLGSPDGGE